MKCIWPADLTYRGNDPNSYHPYYSETRPYELKSNEDEYDFSQIARLIRIINQDPDSLETVLNVKQVLQYLAINILTGSWDDYRFLKNNFYLYHEPSKDMFHWIPFDYDNTFGVDWFGAIGPPLTLMTMQILMELLDRLQSIFFKMKNM